MRTICITLPETPAREAAARMHFLERGLSVDFIHGIHAQTFGVIGTHTYELDHPGSGYVIGYKHTGLCLSHYMVWNACALLPDKYFLILEDDAKFEAGWKDRFDRAMLDVDPDFDILYVGSCNTVGKPQTKLTGEIHMVEYPMATHAYVVAKKAIPTLLETQRDIFAPIDIALILRTLPKLKVYTVLPRIVDQFGITLAP